MVLGRSVKVTIAKVPGLRHTAGRMQISWNGPYSARRSPAELALSVVKTRACGAALARRPRAPDQFTGVR